MTRARTKIHHTPIYSPTPHSLLHPIDLSRPPRLSDREGDRAWRNLQEGVILGVGGIVCTPWPNEHPRGTGDLAWRETRAHPLQAVHYPFNLPLDHLQHHSHSITRHMAIPHRLRLNRTHRKLGTDNPILDPVLVHGDHDLYYQVTILGLYHLYTSRHPWDSIMNK
jgi:hypothetical protein